MNIKFEKDGVTKETHKKFTDELIKAGWTAVEDKPKKSKKTVKKDK